MTDYTRQLLVLGLVGTQSVRPPTTLATPIRQIRIPSPQFVFGHFVGLQRSPVRGLVRFPAKHSDLQPPELGKGCPETPEQNVRRTMK
jgi:hypothetical protein